MYWLEVLGPSLLLIIGGIATWFIKSRIEELRAVEARLREERRRTYRDLLEPYIRLFAELRVGGTEKAIKQITSFDYRKTAFELVLLGSDEVVRAYNDLMQYTYRADRTESQHPYRLLTLWGELLLQIRKSLVSKRTRLKGLDMLKSSITDIDRLTRREEGEAHEGR